MWACALCLRFWLQVAGGCCRRLNSNLVGYDQLVVPEKLVPGYRCRLTIRHSALMMLCAHSPTMFSIHDTRKGEWRIATSQLR